MTKEQEEAIDRLRKITNRQILYGNKYGIVIEEFKKLQEDIETVLNMLKEKDEEIQFQKDINKTEKDRHKQAEKSLKGHIEKKDKMIDLLVNKLNQNCKVFENSEIKEIVEIYEKIKSTSNLRGIEVRKECIKQYFERKVEDECKR